MSPLRYVAGNSLVQYRANQVLHSLPQERVSRRPMEARSHCVSWPSFTPSAPSPTVSPAEEDPVARRHPIRCLEGSVEGQGPLKSFVQYPATTADPSRLDVCTINTLPNNVLLSVFRYYMADSGDLEKWSTLARVCRRWRYAMVASADRLNLRLVCTEKSPATEMIGAWPALPIVLKNGGDPTRGNDGDFIAALKHSSRVCEVSLTHLTSIILERVVELAQEPFPQLTSLELAANHDEMTAIVPESFLGGSVPRLQKLDLANIPFPALPKLLLSATDLVYLRIWDVPDSGFISPEAIATFLPAMEKLERFHLGFRSPRPPPGPASRHPPPPTRTTLPALSQFYFRGNSEYLDDLVAHVDAPTLDDFSVTFYNQLVFDTPQLLRFLSRTGKFITLDHAEVLFHGDNVKVKISSSPHRGKVDRESLMLVFRCRGLVWQLSALAQVLRPPLPPLSTLKQLHILKGQHLHPHLEDDTENAEWLQLLQPFTALRDLYLSENLALRIGPALQGLTEDGATRAFPALRNVFSDGPQQSGPSRKPLHSSSRSDGPLATLLPPTEMTGEIWVGYTARGQ